jgi:hypothetical protein
MALLFFIISVCPQGDFLVLLFIHILPYLCVFSFIFGFLAGVFLLPVGQTSQICDGFSEMLSIFG